MRGAKTEYKLSFEAHLMVRLAVYTIRDAKE